MAAAAPESKENVPQIQDVLNDPTGKDRWQAWSASRDLDQIDAVMFDCDGVLWKSQQPIEGAAETVQALRAMGKKVLFVTNNSSKSRTTYAKRLAAMKVGHGDPQEIFGSSYAAATWLDNNSSFDKATMKALAIGHAGVSEELREKGIEVVEANKVVGDRHFDPEEFLSFQIDPSIGAVVCGFDQRLTYSKIAYAAHVLHNNPDCLFISTNQDATYPAPDRVLPGGGSCVRMLATAAQREPVNVGKPEPVLMDLALAQFDLDPGRTLMVGDRMDTDMLFARRAGVKSCLVFTGISTPKVLLAQKDESMLPLFAARSVRDLIAPQESS